MNAQLLEKIESILELKIGALPEEILFEISKSLERLKSPELGLDINELYRALLVILNMHLNKPWGEMIEYVNANPDFIEFANNFALKAANGHCANPLLVGLLVCLLEHNNILFHKNADYTVYQKLVDRLSFLVFQADPILKARMYSDSVYADYIFMNEESKKFFENELMASLKLFEDNHLLVNERFLAYINASQFCLFKGEHERTICYLEQAKGMLNSINVQNYKALFWYHYSWIYVETGDYHKAKENIGSFFTNIKESLVSPAIYLHAMNISASIEARLGNYEQAFIWANQCYGLAIKFYESEAKDVVAESLVTMSRYYKTTKSYDQAERTIKHAIAILETIFGSPELDPSQAAAHVLLGDIYLETQQYKQAKAEYTFAEKYYESFYKENLYNMNEVSIVLANLAILGFRSNDKESAQLYMQKLTANFPSANDNVKRAQAAFKEFA